MKSVPTSDTSAHARRTVDVIYANMSVDSGAILHFFLEYGHLTLGPFITFVWSPFSIHWYPANFTLWV